MKKEPIPYDYYYETISPVPAMMVANGHVGMHSMHHPFNLEDNFLQILGKHYIASILIESMVKWHNKCQSLSIHSRLAIQTLFALILFVYFVSK